MNSRDPSLSTRESGFTQRPAESVDLAIPGGSVRWRVLQAERTTCNKVNHGKSVRRAVQRWKVMREEAGKTSRTQTIHPDDGKGRDEGIKSREESGRGGITPCTGLVPHVLTFPLKLW